MKTIGVNLKSFNSKRIIETKLLKIYLMSSYISRNYSDTHLKYSNKTMNYVSNHYQFNNLKQYVLSRRQFLRMEIKWRMLILFGSGHIKIKLLWFVHFISPSSTFILGKFLKLPSFHFSIGLQKISLCITLKFIEQKHYKYSPCQQNRQQWK